MKRIALAAAVLATPALSQTPASPSPTPDYAQPDTWLCRPGRDDACMVNQDVTVVPANGRPTVERFKPAAAPAFDCFYVYPTVSHDASPNSDMIAGGEELQVAAAQAARFRAKCRVFAPLYRQVTLTALRQVMTGGTPAVDRAMALADVTAAWNSYLAHDNGGRGVVLIGHSQGSGLLKQLITQSIEGQPAQRRVIAAYLLGTNVAVPAGQAVGGDLKSMPICTRAGQYGCVVTYVTFRADSPPPANSRFGKVPQPGMIAACVNPAALAGGKAVTDAIFTTQGAGEGERDAGKLDDGDATARDAVRQGAGADLGGMRQAGSVQLSGGDGERQPGRRADRHGRWRRDGERSYPARLGVAPARHAGGDGESGRAVRPPGGGVARRGCRAAVDRSG